jgi:hypothetical protein
MAATSSKQPPDEETRIQPLMFKALAADGTNYLEWSINIKSYLSSVGLETALTSPTPEDLPTTSRWKALFTLRRHLSASLQQQYLQADNLGTLWNQLVSRFHHEQTIFLPQARTDWIGLRVMDFPNILAFDAELHRIVAQLRLCGETITEKDLIDKTLSTFPPASATLSQQFRLIKCTTHSMLMSHLLLAEKQQAFLLKNAESKPVETHTLEVATRKPKREKKHSHKANQGGSSRSSKDKSEKPYSKSEKNDKGDKSD